MTAPVRVKPSARYVKSLAKLGEPLASRATKAITKFYKEPKTPGLNFEAVKNRPGHFTIRVDRNFRILLKAEEDKQGQYFLLVDIADHDDTYSDR